MKEDYGKPLGIGDKLCSEAEKQDYLRAWRAFWNGYKQLHGLAGEGIVSIDEARDILRNAYAQLRVHEAAPARGDWPELASGLMNDLVGAAEKAQELPLDVRARTRQYVASRELDAKKRADSSAYWRSLRDGMANGWISAGVITVINLFFPVARSLLPSLEDLLNPSNAAAFIGAAGVLGAALNHACYMRNHR